MTAKMTKLLWYGQGRNSGWRCYEDTDGSVFFMYTGNSGSRKGARGKTIPIWRKLPMASVPTRVLEAAARKVGSKL